MDTVKVRYLLADGAGVEELTSTMPPESRTTFGLHSSVASGRAATHVTCATPGKKIMVERAMYWNARSAGASTIGGYSD